MSSYNIIEIMPEVTLIEDFSVNIYVVEGKDSAIVIDTGYGVRNLKKAVEEIVKDKPLTVVYTHGHIDHAFGGHYFDKVYMSRDEMPVYERHTQRKSTMEERIAKEYGVTHEGFEVWRDSRPQKIEFIAPGHIFDIGGNTLEVISLRGHTPGSIGLIDKKHRILFSGDGLNNHIWMQLVESTTLEEYFQTLKAVEPFRKEFDMIHMGHQRDPKPEAFIDVLEQAVKDLLEGAVGIPYNNPIASVNGLIYKREDSEVVYDPARIR